MFSTPKRWTSKSSMWGELWQKVGHPASTRIGSQDGGFILATVSCSTALALQLAEQESWQLKPSAVHETWEQVFAVNPRPRSMPRRETRLVARLETHRLDMVTHSAEQAVPGYHEMALTVKASGV